MEVVEALVWRGGVLDAALLHDLTSRRRVRTALRSGEVDALMAHWAFVTPRLVRSVAGSGGELYVWTVDDAARIAALERLGVTGIITNDPRLFSARSRTRAGTP